MTAHRPSARRPVIALALTGLLVLPPTAATAAATDSTANRTGESARIDRWVDERMTARDLPGVAVAVVRGGHLVHLAGYGVADDTGHPVTPDTPFLLGSVSKPFTAAVVGQLVEEGALTWDEPVWPHLTHLVDQVPAGFETVTVDQLVTHTGGLGMFVGIAGEVTLHEGAGALDRRVAELLTRPLAHPPGETFTYSNAGFMLLAAVVEQVTGDSFANQLHARIFDPLGMSGSFATASDHRAADLATGHRQWFGRWRPAALPFDDAGVAMGYVASTARDLALFMQAHLDSHPAIPSTAAEIAAGRVAPTGWTTTLDAGYGRGWFVDELAGTIVVSHPGSLGHFTGHLLLAPDADGLGIAVLSNASAFLAGGPGDRGHDAQYDLGFGLLRILLGQEHQPVDPTPLMTLALPVGAWAFVALLPIAVLRPVFGRQRRDGAGSGMTTRRARIRQLLPGAFAMIVGAGLLTAPLGMARHFHPDTGWALTSLAWLALTLGAARLTLTLFGERVRTSTAERTPKPERPAVTYHRGPSVHAEPPSQPRLPPRWLVRTFWYGHRALLRASRGRVGLWRPKPNGWGALRLTTTGRRTGRPRQVVVGYFEDGPDLVTMAMNGWGNGEPAWWLNLQAHPDAVVELADGPRRVTAREAEGEERERLWTRWREITKNLDAYAALRSTDTAVVVLAPRSGGSADPVS